MSDRLIIICSECKPTLGKMEEISIGVLIGRCEECGSTSSLHKFWRNEYEAAVEMDLSAVQVSDDVQPGPSVKFKL